MNGTTPTNADRLAWYSQARELLRDKNNWTIRAYGHVWQGKIDHCVIGAIGMARLGRERFLEIIQGIANPLTGIVNLGEYIYEMTDGLEDDLRRAALAIHLELIEQGKHSDCTHNTANMTDARVVTARNLMVCLNDCQREASYPSIIKVLERLITFYNVQVEIDEINALDAIAASIDPEPQPSPAFSFKPDRRYIRELVPA